MGKQKQMSVCGLVLGGWMLVGCQTTALVPPALAQDAGVVSEAASVGTVPAAVEEAPAFSAEGIAALEARMAQYVAEGHVYGIATRLVHRGEIVSDLQAGVMKLEAQKPIADDTIYRIYSMTKPITGVAMMMLWEDGAFSLDDPVTKYVPEFEGLRVLDGVAADGTPILVDAERPPTILEIMSHTAGFAYGLCCEDPANAAFRDQNILQAPDLETFIDLVSDVPLLFQPGEAWAYSASVDIQGYLVQKLSGQSFGDFLQTRVFEPLGMTDTAFAVGPDKYDRFSEVYGRHPETGELVPVPYPTVQFTPDTIPFESGGGGLTATLGDYTRFSQMLLNGGELDGVRILKADTVERMRTNVLSEGMSLFSDGSNQRDAAGLGFGLDFGTVEDPAATGIPYGKGTYFWGGAAGTWFWIDPANELFFIGMIQTFDRDGPIGQVRDVSATHVYEALNHESAP